MVVKESCGPSLVTQRFGVHEWLRLRTPQTERVRGPEAAQTESRIVSEAEQANAPGSGEEEPDADWLPLLPQQREGVGSDPRHSAQPDLLIHLCNQLSGTATLAA